MVTSFNIQATTQFFEELKATVFFMLIKLEMQLQRQSKVYPCFILKPPLFISKGLHWTYKPKFFPGIFENLGR